MSPTIARRALRCLIAASGLALLTAVSSTAQSTSNRKISIDMLTDLMSDDEQGCVFQGERLVVEVKNVNPFLYSVTINAESKSPFRDVPEAFKNLAKNASAGIKDEAGRTPENLLVDDDFRKAYAAFQNAIDLKAKEIGDLRGFGELFHSRLSQPYLDLNALKTYLDAQLTRIGQPTLVGTTDFEWTAQRLVEPIMTAYQILKGQYEALKPPTAAQKDAFDRATKLMKTLESFPEEMAAVGGMYADIQGMSSTFVYSTDAKGDDMKVTIKGTPVPRNVERLSANVNEFSREEIVHLCGGISLNFSTGLLFSTVVNHSYTLKDTFIVRTESDTITAKQILRDDPAPLSFGPGALVHINYRSFPVSVGGVFGILTNNYSNVNYVGGLGVSLRDDDVRIAISGGASYGKVTRLKTGLSDQYIMPVAKGASVNAAPTLDDYAWGWFFGVTWNLP